MTASVEYRIKTDAMLQHQRPEDEGVRVSMSAVQSNLGKQSKELDLEESAIFSTFVSNYESFIAANAMSSVSNMDNVYFREIVKMGRKAVPYIYRELQKGPTDLVYALDEIFGHPIKYSGFVPLKQTCDTWISILKQTEKV